VVHWDEEVSESVCWAGICSTTAVCLIDSMHTPSFCVVKVRMQDMVARRVSSNLVYVFMWVCSHEEGSITVVWLVTIAGKVEHTSL